MPTTIQINERTLAILKKLKERIHASSYDETINKIAVQRVTREASSMAGSLKKYFKKTHFKKILKDLQNERRKSNRF